VDGTADDCGPRSGSIDNGVDVPVLVPCDGGGDADFLARLKVGSMLGEEGWMGELGRS
jgi:hypothetical protein